MGAGNMTTKYGFRIRTRAGMVVENLHIHGRDQADAQRKLEQMYHHCQILECRTVPVAMRIDPSSFEGVLSVVTK